MHFRIYFTVFVSLSQVIIGYTTIFFYKFYITVKPVQADKSGSITTFTHSNIFWRAIQAVKCSAFQSFSFNLKVFLFVRLFLYVITLLWKHTGKENVYLNIFTFEVPDPRITEVKVWSQFLSRHEKKIMYYDQKLQNCY